MRRHRINNLVIVFLIIFFSLIFAILILLVTHRDKQIEDRWKEEAQRIEEEISELERSMQIIVYGNEPDSVDKSDLVSAVDIINGNIEGEVIASADYFAENCKLTSGYISDASASLSLGAANIDKDDIVGLQFVAYTIGESATLQIDFSGRKNSIYLSPTPTEYFIILTGATVLDNVSFTITSDFVNTIIDCVYIVNYGNFDVSKVKIGSYAKDNRKNIEISTESVTQENSTQCLVDDSFLYSIYNGKLHIYKILGSNETELITSLGPLGNTRDMSFNKDKSAIIISSRQDGIYIIDIMDPYQASILSHYDSLEAATGIAVYGNYAFICSRYFGVEIVDISDLNSPKYVNKISNNVEYQDCFVDGQFLYVGVYNAKSIDIYDISNLTSPVFASSIALDGAGQGVYVADNVLYAATGLNSANDSSKLWSYGTGTGNGLQIYDVSNPYNPQLLSITKIDGRYNYRSNDIWDVQVSGNYAYVTNMHNGLLVYDVSDLKNPICVKSYSLIIRNNDDKFVELTNDKYVFSWEVSNESRGAAYHVALTDGSIYIAMANAGIYVLPDDNAKAITRDYHFEYSVAGEDQILEVPGYNTSVFKTDSSIWAVVYKDGYIYVAAGENGILVLDTELNLINNFDTETSVRDVKIYGEYLFAAEGTAGIGVYKVNKFELTKISSLLLKYDTNFASQIELTEDGNYLIAQIAQNYHAVIDSSNPYNLVWTDITSNETGAMYYRNICTGLVDGKYLGVFGSDGICWYYSDGGILAALNTTDNPFYREYGGMVAVGDICVAITDGGYKYFDIGTTISSPTVKVEGNTLTGKAAYGDDILVVSSAYDGVITILDISDISSPVFISRFTVAGNPDIAYVSNDIILIPCRYGGLIMLTK